MLAVAWETRDPLENSQEQTLHLPRLPTLAPISDVGSGGKIITISLTRLGAFAFVFNTFQHIHPTTSSEYMTLSYKIVFSSRLFLFTR